MTDYEQAYRDLRAGVEALADEWQANYDRWKGVHDGPRVAIFDVHARKVRALLASSAPATASECEWKGCDRPGSPRCSFHTVTDDFDFDESPATASEGATEALRRAVGVRLAQEFERKNASQKPDVYMADTWLFAADAALDVIAARPTRDEFRARVRSILVDRAALDEHIEEFFDEVLDDIVDAHLSHPTLTGVTSSDGDRGLSEEDGPECETCGRTTCPDAGLPAFSDPRACEYAPIYEELRAAKDCDYGCGRDFTNQELRLWLVPAVEHMFAARTDQPEGTEREKADRG